MAATSSKKRGAAGAKKQQPRGNPQKARVSRDPAHVAKPTVGDWIGAARLRTLPLAVTPIL
ncbi:1,4-dihydroxy-2-naphthoate polyprenyltransferase, partial [Microbacterium sp. B35-04]